MSSKKPVHAIAKFHSLTKSISGEPTDRIIALLDKAGYWDNDAIEYVVLNYKRQHVRHLMGRVKRPDDQRLFVNVQKFDSRGRKKNLYKDREELTLTEFKQVAELFVRSGMKDLATAQSLAADCMRIHGVQLELFGDAGEGK